MAQKPPFPPNTGSCLSGSPHHTCNAFTTVEYPYVITRGARTREQKVKGLSLYRLSWSGVTYLDWRFIAM